MSEYISREALLKRLDMASDCKKCPRCVNMKTYYDRCAYTDIQDVCSVISDMPAADVQPIKRGYWKDIMMSEATGWDLSLTGGRDDVLETVCSVCGDCCAFDGDGEPYLSTYCPNCGAYMGELSGEMGIDELKDGDKE